MTRTPAHLIGRPAYGFADLAAKYDLASSAWVFPPYGGDEYWWSVVRSFLPREGVVDKSKKDRVPYLTWEADGWLTLTPGNVTDHEFIAESIYQDAQLFDVREYGYDPWNSTQFAVMVENEYGIHMEPVRQGFTTLSEATKTFGALLVEGKWRHLGNPVETWAVGNMVVKEDAAGNIKPDKAKATQKIDPAVAIIGALSLAIKNADHGPKYLTGELEVI